MSSDMSDLVRTKSEFPLCFCRYEVFIEVYTFLHQSVILHNPYGAFTPAIFSTIAWTLTFRLSNGWNCTIWVHSHLRFGQLLHGLKNSIMVCIPIFLWLRLHGLKSSRSSLRLKNRRCELNLPVKFQTVMNLNKIGRDSRVSKKAIEKSIWRLNWYSFHYSCHGRLPRGFHDK